MAANIGRIRCKRVERGAARLFTAAYGMIKGPVSAWGERIMKGFWHEQRVRERAYELWERAGRPEGMSAQHWAQAEAEISAEEQGLDEEIKREADGAV